MRKKELNKKERAARAAKLKRQGKASSARTKANLAARKLFTTTVEGGKPFFELNAEWNKLHPPYSPPINLVGTPEILARRKAGRERYRAQRDKRDAHRLFTTPVVGGKTFLELEAEWDKLHPHPIHLYLAEVAAKREKRAAKVARRMLAEERAATVARRKYKARKQAELASKQN